MRFMGKEGKNPHSADFFLTNGKNVGGGESYKIWKDAENKLISNCFNF